MAALSSIIPVAAMIPLDWANLFAPLRIPVVSPVVASISSLILISLLDLFIF